MHRDHHTPGERLPTLLLVGLTLACAGLLAATHLALYTTRTEFPHLDDLVSHLRQYLAGAWWSTGPDLWETGLQPGGPIFYWLNLPALLLGQPVTALHRLYFLYELAALLCWIAVGTRARLGAGVTWVGALLLAAHPASKLVVCENMTLAAILSYPLFITAAAALTRPGWRPMLLPGLLAAAMVHCHAATLVALPGLLLVLALEPRRLLPRLGGFALGWAAIMLLALPGWSIQGVAGLPAFVARLLGGFDSADLLARLFAWPWNPAVLLGAGLVLLHRSDDGGGHRAHRAAGRLALPWLLFSYLALTLVLSLISRSDGAGAGLGVTLPARAALSGVAVAWLLGLAARGPLSRLASPVALPLLVLVAALGLTGWRGVQAVAGRAAFQKTFAAEHRGPCPCQVWRQRSTSRYAGRYYDALGELMPERGRLELIGPLEENFGPAFFWLARAREGGRRPGPTLPAVIAPRLATGPLAGVRSSGPLTLLRGLTPLEVTPPNNARRFSLGPDSSQGGTLLVFIEGEQHQRPAGPPTLFAGGRRLEPRSRCQCLDGPGNYAAWLLYDLEPARAAGRLRLEVPQETSVHQAGAATLPAP